MRQARETVTVHLDADPHPNPIAKFNDLGLAKWLYLCHTSGMKTAISIPDNLFAVGEQLAQDLAITRSELYRRALYGFLKDQGGQVVTDALDSVYGDTESSALDPYIALLQGVSVPRTDEGW